MRRIIQLPSFVESRETVQKRKKKEKTKSAPFWKWCEMEKEKKRMSFDDKNKLNCLHIIIVFKTVTS